MTASAASAHSRSFTWLQQLFMNFVQLTIDVADLAKFELKFPLVKEFGTKTPPGGKFWNQIWENAI